MTVRKLASILISAILLLAACAPTEDDVPREPTAIPFPTMTPGVSVQGRVPLAGMDAGVSPATAVAIANQPTPMPDQSACPTRDGDNRLSDALPDTNTAIISEIVRFLSAGGEPSILRETLRDEWEVLGETGSVRDNADLTGEGQPDIILSYSAPDEGGTLVVMGCVDRRYEVLYSADSDQITPPEVVLLGDMNRDERADLLFTTRRCDSALSETCSTQTQLVTYTPTAGRFLSLLGTLIIAENAAQPLDIDNDEVNELVLLVDNEGTQTTGPLRTGTNIYDWDGETYVLSIVQPDPPAYRIQIVHEADRQLIDQDVQTAITLYQQALSNDDLRNWFDDEEDTLTSYILYRLLTAQAFAASPQITSVYQSIVQTFPSPEQNTTFLEMAQVFWDVFNTSGGNPGVACTAVREYVAQNPAPLNFMNRYGTRSPVYSAQELCPLETIVIEGGTEPETTPEPTP